MEHKEKNYCCFCGKKLVLKTLYDGSVEKYCTNCDYVFFNTPSPAVIVMITNSNKVLLARAIDWKHPYWGLISGHIKIGETAEEAVFREVREEVGIKVFNIQFLKTYLTLNLELLMIAFSAKTEETTFKKSQELENASWFDLNDLLPMRSTSIAAQIVKQVFPKVMYRDLEN